jgi:hypothetical protein
MQLGIGLSNRSLLATITVLAVINTAPSGGESNTPLGVKRSGSQWNGECIVARGPENILNHLALSSAR